VAIGLLACPLFSFAQMPPARLTPSPRQPRSFSAVATQAHTRWNWLRSSGAQPIQQIGGLPVDDLELAVEVGRAPVSVGGAFNTAQRASFEQQVTDALDRHPGLQDLAVGGMWLHKGSPHASFRVRFPCQTSHVAEALGVAAGMQAQGLTVGSAGGHTLACRVVAAACPVQCVTVKLTGVAGSTRRGTVKQLLEAAGYGPEARVVQEFMGATQLGSRTVANPSVVLAYVEPPEGDERLVNLPDAVPGLGGNPAPTRVEVIGAGDLARLREFARGRQRVVTAPPRPQPPGQQAPGAGTSSGRSQGGSAGRLGGGVMEVEQGPPPSAAVDRFSPGQAPLGPSPGRASQGGSGFAAGCPPHPPPAVPRALAPQGRPLTPGKRARAAAEGWETAFLTPLAGVLVEWVQDQCDGAADVVVARGLVRNFFDSHKSLFLSEQSVSCVGQLPRAVVRALEVVVAAAGHPAVAGYGDPESDCEGFGAGEATGSRFAVLSEQRVADGAQPPAAPDSPSALPLGRRKSLRIAAGQSAGGRTPLLPPLDSTQVPCGPGRGRFPTSAQRSSSAGRVRP